MLLFSLRQIRHWHFNLYCLDGVTVDEYDAESPSYLYWHKCHERGGNQVCEPPVKGNKFDLRYLNGGLNGTYSKVTNKSYIHNVIHNSSHLSIFRIVRTVLMLCNVSCNNKIVTIKVRKE